MKKIQWNENVIERLKKIRTALNLTQSEFAEQLRLQRNTISLLETGKRNPSERTIDDICNIFNVSKEYLLNGTEPMFTQTYSDTMEQLKKEFNLDEFSFNLVHEYLKLDPAQREKVRDFFYRVVELESDEQEERSIQQEADEFGALAREQFIAEKRQESQTLSVKKSDAS